MNNKNLTSPLSALICLVSLCLQFMPAAQAQPVTSTADTEVLARIHFNTQTADFERTRGFYRLLGYTQGVGNFPKTNTHAMARSLGMYELCSYEIDSIEVISIPGAQGPTAIDLIQFRVPFNDEPPYASPTHLGMAYAALGTPSFSADYAYLRQQGVSFLSEPYGEPGSRFVFMQDPDGVFLKLVETAAADVAAAAGGSGVNINDMPYIGLNVSDLNESLRFYRSLGYREVGRLPQQGSLAEARAWGLDRPFSLRGADIRLAGGDQHTLRLLQWLEPRDDAPPYPAPISHIGIHRIALAVQNLDRAVAALSALGVEFLSEIAPCCSGTGLDESGIINAIDPDGIFVELVGPIAQRQPQPAPAVCADNARNRDGDFTRFTVP